MSDHIQLKQLLAILCELLERLQDGDSIEGDGEHAIDHLTLLAAQQCKLVSIFPPPVQKVRYERNLDWRAIRPAGWLEADAFCEARSASLFRARNPEIVRIFGYRLNDPLVRESAEYHTDTTTDVADMSWDNQAQNRFREDFLKTLRRWVRWINNNNTTEMTPTREPNNTQAANHRSDSADSAGLMSANDVAAKHRVPLEALRKRLSRWQLNHDTGYVEVENRRRNEPKFLYDENAIRPVIEELKSATNRPSNVHR